MNGSLTRSALHGWAFRCACLAGLVLAGGGLAQAQSPLQYLGTCRPDAGDSTYDLRASIHLYHEHTWRLDEKFASGYYWQGKVKPDLKPINLETVLEGLHRLEPRKSAVLFYAMARSSNAGGAGDRLCSWLISPYLSGADSSGKPQPFLRASVPISSEALGDLRTRIVESLGVAPAGPGRRAPGSAALVAPDPADLTSALERARQTILPDGFVAAIEARRIDTIVVLPIFDFGAIPFAALPISGGRTLIDIASIVVAPGFFVFREPIRPARASFDRALVLANPRPSGGVAAESSALLEEEAQRVAAAVKPPAEARQATTALLTEALKSEPPPPLIYIAAHGRADELDPLDGSCLFFVDGPLPAKRIAKLKLSATRPVVVLSACETALGKDFEVGAIGLARAWYQAGASNVVMSLWNIYQRSTHRLMVDLVGDLPGCPPDKALQAAAIQARRGGLGLSTWAAFSVYGYPEWAAADQWQAAPNCGTPADRSQVSTGAPRRPGPR